MSELPNKLNNLLNDFNGKLAQLETTIESILSETGYTVVEKSVGKPWGMYLRMHNNEADEFIVDFFEGLSPNDARLGNAEAKLTPKLLIVSPLHQLSLQVHNRRAERWMFLTDGYFYKGKGLDIGAKRFIHAGQAVQFEHGETHRLCGRDKGFVVVAEIWQHTDSNHLSDEDDITRLEDDYSR